jgi:hypothetical protein
MICSFSSKIPNFYLKNYAYSILIYFLHFFFISLRFYLVYRKHENYKIKLLSKIKDKNNSEFNQ